MTKAAHRIMQGLREAAAHARGERSLTLTCFRGPWPGIYRFASGRLVSIERAPLAAAPEKPQKSMNSAKKPAGT
jgi:hypothetical protein